MGNERKQRLIRVGAVLATLFMSAMLLAKGTTQLLAASLLPLERTKAAANTPPPRPPEPSARELAEGVLNRNIFDSALGPISWDLPVAAAPAASPDQALAVVEDPNGEPEFCQQPLRLVASFVVPNVPELSFASIESNGKTRLYRTGMSVDGNALVGIREHRVFIRGAGRPLCQVMMFKPPAAAPGVVPPLAAVTPPPAETAAPPPSTNPPAGGLSDDELGQGITQVTDTQYNVARSLIDKVLSNQAELMRSARVIPYEENGRTIGVKVYGIRRSSLLGRLGIQNGDVLRTINGFDLSSPDSALQAYTKLREADNVSIAMIRRGSPRTMDYTFR